MKELLRYSGLTDADKQVENTARDVTRLLGWDKLIKMHRVRDSKFATFHYHSAQEWANRASALAEIVRSVVLSGRLSDGAPNASDVAPEGKDNLAQMPALDDFTLARIEALSFSEQAQSEILACLRSERAAPLKGTTPAAGPLRFCDHQYDLFGGVHVLNNMVGEVKISRAFMDTVAKTITVEENIQHFDPESGNYATSVITSAAVFAGMPLQAVQAPFWPDQDCCAQFLSLMQSTARKCAMVMQPRHYIATFAEGQRIRIVDSRTPAKQPAIPPHELASFLPDTIWLWVSNQIEVDAIEAWNASATSWSQKSNLLALAFHAVYEHDKNPDDLSLAAASFKASVRKLQGDHVVIADEVLDFVEAVFPRFDCSVLQGHRIDLPAPAIQGLADASAILSLYKKNEAKPAVSQDSYVFQCRLPSQLIFLSKVPCDRNT